MHYVRVQTATVVQLGREPARVKTTGGSSPGG
jgi:hypothetical protein